MIYKVAIKGQGQGQGQGIYSWTLYQQTLSGEIVNENVIGNNYVINKCFEGDIDTPIVIQLYEKAGALHLFSIAALH